MSQDTEPGEVGGGGGYKQNSSWDCDLTGQFPEGGLNPRYLANPNPPEASLKDLGKKVSSNQAPGILQISVN